MAGTNMWRAPWRGLGADARGRALASPLQRAALMSPSSTGAVPPSDLRRDTGEAQLRFRDGSAPDLSVRRFTLRQAMSEPFAATIVARSTDPALPLDELVGKRLSLSIGSERAATWHGLCRGAELLAVPGDHDEDGLATYRFSLVPVLWRATQRRGSRLFQHRTIPQIVTRLLDHWRVAHRWAIDPALHPRLELRTQLDEDDAHFIHRLLEEAGIAYHFVEEDDETVMVLDDAPQEVDPVEPIGFAGDPNLARHRRHATEIRVAESSKPGRVTIRDDDFLQPRRVAFVSAASDRDFEGEHEQFLYAPGAFLTEGIGPAPASTTPVADDLGHARRTDARGQWLARLRLEALDSQRTRLSWQTNVLGLRPGQRVVIDGHPHPVVSDPAGVLVTSVVVEGEAASVEPWVARVEAVPSHRPYRPSFRHDKPRVEGVLTAIVVGKALNIEPADVGGALPHSHLARAMAGGLELGDNSIYVDEHGRVRVQFPFDRDHGFDGHSSAWIRVSHGSAGGGQGQVSPPRVGQEVLVAFVGGDPDVPVITGRLHNAAQPLPHPLPANATVSSWKTSTTPSTGGFNELRFDDANGREHLYLQAERDMDHLVKHDLRVAVGDDRATYVQSDDAVVVGNDRTKLVNFNEHETTGLNRHQSVGVNRTSTVGSEDSTLVGTRWSVTVARGLAATMPRELESLADTLGGVMRSAAVRTLGRYPQDPLAAASEATLFQLGRRAWSRLRETVTSFGGYETEPGPPPTGIEVADRMIRLTTGEASIVLDGPNVSIQAQGNIALHALNSLTLLAEDEIALAGGGRVAVVSANRDAIVQAGGDVHLNPFVGSANLEPGMAAAPIAPIDRSASRGAEEEEEDDDAI